MTVEQDVIQAVLIVTYAHSSTWSADSDERWFLGLVEEVGELAEALRGTHEHPPEVELAQIASICLNWLQRMKEIRTTLEES